MKTIYVENKGSTFHLLKDPTGVVGRYMFERGLKIMAAAKVKVGKTTGALAASINISQEPTTTGQKMTIGSPLRYAFYHHEGTRPHLIRADSGGFLRFSSRGRIVYSRQIMHPGTRPNRYLTSFLYMVR
jgi:hypothetical protein